MGLNQKMVDINNLINRSWTEAELQEKLTKSGALVQKFIPIERNRLNGLIKEARARGDTAKEEELRKELEALDGPKLAYSTSMQPSPKKSNTPQGMSQQERLAILNRQNRRKNAEEVRQAQINERRAAKQIETALKTQGKLPAFWRIESVRFELHGCGSVVCTILECNI